ncbi:hypothetical protein ADJ73_11540 [Arsenicicoccus sp. oral taxon 190]|nr:hypothetical protein ADJ73_11540 [Arsenicicoccus sp. oral taxon 190]
MTRVVQVPTGASFGFAVPSGRTVCVVTNGEGTSVSCTFAPAGFAPMAPRSDCPGESRTVLGLTAGRAAQGCVVEPLVEQALLGTPHTAWWQNGRDAYLPTQPPMPKGRLAVLGHGSSMAVGTTRCTVTDTGVECRDSGTGQGFDVTRNGYRFVR